MGRPDHGVRIGGAGGFWGDITLAPLEMLKTTELDYLTMDYLSEVTMSIMHKQLDRNPSAGWATDLEVWLRAGGMELLKEKKVKLVTNAGGANTDACVSRVLKAASAIGWTDCKVATISGDCIGSKLSALAGTGEPFIHMFDHKLGSLLDHEETIVSANAYLGASGIARALEQGADIVITGRVADASLIVGSMAHSCGWAANGSELELNAPLADWAPPNIKNPYDVLAGWTLAGHLIECGAQVSGGNSSDWKEIPQLAELTYPLAIIESDGTCVITRAPGEGGRITRRTVAEQMLYEIGDPTSYHTPDVTLDLSQATLVETKLDHVRVKGARGRSPPASLKVSACHRDGWMSSGSLMVPGPNAQEKAEMLDNTMRGRLNHLSDIQIETEFLGSQALTPPGLRKDISPSEVMVRWTISSPQRAQLTHFARSIAPLVLTGPAGVAGYGARPRPREVLRFFPTSIRRVLVEPQVRIEHHQTWRHDLEERMPWLEDKVLARLEMISKFDNHPYWSKLASRMLDRLDESKVVKP